MLKHVKRTLAVLAVVAAVGLVWGGMALTHWDLVTTIPEPSALALLSMAALALLAIGWRDLRIRRTELGTAKGAGSGATAHAGPLGSEFGPNLGGGSETTKSFPWRLAKVTLICVAVVLPWSATANGDTLVGDNFDDGVLDPSLWEITEHSGEIPVVREENGKLEFGGPAGISSSATVKYKPQIVGDVDIWLDYDWIATTNHKSRLYLMLMDADRLNGVELAFIRHDYNARQRLLTLYHVVNGANVGEPGWTRDIDFSGRLRMVREGTTYSGYYWDSGSTDWELLGSVEHDGPLDSFFIHGSNSHLNPLWEVHVDNFSCVPEPSTLVLGGMAAVVLLACARGRWKRAA